MTQLPDTMFVIDSNAEDDRREEARPHGHPGVSVVDTNCAIPTWSTGLFRATMIRTARHPFVHHDRLPTPLRRGRAQYEPDPRLPTKKAAADQARAGSRTGYVDTSAYEKYEKQEGEFVEGTEAFIDAAATTGSFRTRTPVNNGARLNYSVGPVLKAKSTPGQFCKVVIANLEKRKEKRMSTSKTSYGNSSQARQGTERTHERWLQ